MCKIVSWKQVNKYKESLVILDLGNGIEDESDGRKQDLCCLTL